MEAFKQLEIVGDILDDIPPGILKVEYAGHEVIPGGQLTPTQVKNEPEVHWSADEDSLYTLIMIDPDVPSRLDRHKGQINHWMVINIPGCHVNQGDVIIEYVGSGPGAGSGLHRYTFLIYKQSRKLSGFTKVSRTTIEGRRHWNVRQVAAQYGLQLVAGNFYQAEHDDYVIEIHRQFGLVK